MRPWKAAENKNGSVGEAAIALPGRPVRLFVLLFKPLNLFALSCQEEAAVSLLFQPA